MLEYLSFMWKVRVGWIFQTFQASTQTKQEIRLPEFWAESVGPKHRIILSSADLFVQKRFAWRVLCYVLVYFARSWTVWTWGAAATQSTCKRSYHRTKLTDLTVDLAVGFQKLAPGRHIGQEVMSPKECLLAPDHFDSRYHGEVEHSDGKVIVKYSLNTSKYLSIGILEYRYGSTLIVDGAFSRWIFFCEVNSFLVPLEASARFQLATAQSQENKNSAFI